MRHVATLVMGLWLTGSAVGQEVLHEWQGDAPYNLFGEQIHSLGDLNGDGCSEVAVLARGPFDGGTLVLLPYLRVYSGKDGSQIYHHTPGYGHTYRGFTAIDDVDGDGVPDFAFTDQSGAGTASVLLFSGADQSFLFSVPDPDATSPSQFGTSLDGGKDLNGDGLGDFLAGSPGFGFPFLGSGSVRLFSGANGALLFEDLGGAILDDFGRSVAFVGDLNGDGVEEFAASASRLTQDGNGYARVYSGIDQSLLFTIEGSRPESEYGNQILGIADCNGDQIPDFLITAPESNHAGDKTGSVFFYSGADGTKIRRVNGANIDDRFGSFVADAGDVNADGVRDYLITTDVDPAGSRLGGEVCLFSGATGDELYVFTGDESAGLGSALSGVADVNGDDIGDFFLTSTGFDESRGKAVAVSGSELFLQSAKGSVVPSEPFDVKAAGGVPSRGVVLYLEAIDERTIFVPLTMGLNLGSEGNFTFGLNGPALSPSGTKLTFRAFSRSDEGKITMSASEDVVIGGPRVPPVPQAWNQ